MHYYLNKGDFILSAQTGAYCDQYGLQEILNYVADIGRDVAGLFDAAGLDRRDVPEYWSATMLEKFAEPLENVDFKGLIERFFFVGFTSGVLGNNWREEPCHTLH